MLRQKDLQEDCNVSLFKIPFKEKELTFGMPTRRFSGCSDLRCQSCEARPMVRYVQVTAATMIPPIDQHI